MTAGPGHNNGPAFDGGLAWRKHCWKKARAELIPHLPIEILRGRVRRAQEIGLDYKTYASVRASTGRDVIGFLFSSNALRAFRTNKKIPTDRVEKLVTLSGCQRIALVTAPLTTAGFAKANPDALFDLTAPSPGFSDTWSASRQHVLTALSQRKLPADAVLLIGDTTLEREWSEAGRLAGYLPAERYFPNPVL